MGEQYITMAELEEKYPGHWVLLDRPKKDRSETVVGGHLLWSHRDRDEFDRRLMEFKSRHVAVLHIFDPNEDEPEFIRTWHEVRFIPADDSSTSPAG